MTGSGKNIIPSCVGHAPDHKNSSAPGATTVFDFIGDFSLLGIVCILGVCIFLLGIVFIFGVCIFGMVFNPRLLANNAFIIPLAC